MNTSKLFIIILGILMIGVTGCAHAEPGAPGAIPGSTSAAGASRLGSKGDSAATHRGTTVMSASGRTSTDPLGTLEEGLSKVHSDRVTVSTALLKSLVRNQRIQQTQCKNISGQLEALKNIDLQETQEVTE
jgi:hypothetical protein